MTRFRDLLDGSQLCAQADPELWWPAGHRAEADAERAKAICRACPFEAPCLSFAMTATDGRGSHIGGIWGATGPQDRDKLRKKRAA